MLRQLGGPIALSVLSGLLLLLSFPSYDLTLLAWIALVPLLLAIRNTSTRMAFGLGMLTGLVFFAGALSWVVNAMHDYGKMSLAISYPVMLLLAAYCALYIGTFSALYNILTRECPSLVVWAAPALWVSLELLRTHLFSGFPWALLGYTQYHNLRIIQIADVTGVYGVAFLLVLVNVVLARLTESVLSRIMITAHPAPIPWVSAVLTATLIPGLIAYGHWRLDHHADSTSSHIIRIGLVQANIDQAHKWDVAFRRETIDRYQRLTAQVAQSADLVIWPEAATPFLFELEPEYRDELLGFVRYHGVPLLFGTPAIKDQVGNQLRLLNSAILVSSDGTVLDRYDKVHLVPFGEYIPLKGILGFLDKLVVGIGDFVPGPGPSVMTGPKGRFGIVICFEVIFPDLVRRFVDLGADYMVTITNDAWFGESSAPYQHFAMVVFRAVENRVAFARAANTGISGFIDADGHILRKTDIFVEGTLTGEVRTGSQRSMYTAYGDVFAYLCVILTVLALAVVGWPAAADYIKRKRSRRRRSDARRPENPPHRPPHAVRRTAEASLTSTH